MKKGLLLTMLMALFMVGFASCSKDDDYEKESSEYKALFYTTDKFVNKLGYNNSFTDSENTSDRKYLVTVIGRLIVVKKNSYSDPSYDMVREALDKHYKSNSRVKDVFINKNGTITIDCRK